MLVSFSEASFGVGVRLDDDITDLKVIRVKTISLKLPCDKKPLEIKMVFTKQKVT